MPLKPSRFLRWTLLAFASVLILLGIIFLGVGRWLVVEDPLEKAQAIAILSGQMPVRAIEAAELYRAGCAPEVWITQTLQPGESLERMGISYPGEDVYSRLVLLHQGVPAEAIHILSTPIENTADEMKVIAAELEARRSATVIIVTTRVHTRRVRTLWHKLAPAHTHAIVRAASSDPFRPERWWRTSNDALDVVREVLGLFNAWAGLPLRHSR